MRTTVTLDPDVVALLESVMRQRGTSFKAALNDAVRAGLGSSTQKRFRTPTFDMGGPLIPLDRALAAADAIGDDATIRELSSGV